MHFKILAFAVMLIGLAACNGGGLNVGSAPELTSTLVTLTPLLPESTQTPIPTPPPARLLTICLLNEPRTLFLYDAVSTSEQTVLSAIYDGPIDNKNYTAQPVIVEKIPSLADGDAQLQPIQMDKGDLMVDAPS
jgi:hypothetical protein